MDDVFSTNVNYSLHQAMPDTTSNLVSDVAGGVVASVVDAGASIWNSLPFTPEVETSDLLRGISSNALRVYEENPETIRLASFIGGMFVPAGLAVKGLGAMRSGMKGVNWFSNAGREADLATVNKLFSEGKGALPEYRAATRALYGRNAVNMAVDTIAVEAALVAMMNSHPFMEDYLDEPVKNFGIGLAVGGVLGLGIGHIAERAAVKAGTSLIESNALSSITEILRPVSSSMTGAIALQSNRMNINALTNIIDTGAAAGKTGQNDLTISMAEKFRTEITKLEFDMFEGTIAGDMAKLGIEDKQVFLQMVATRPELFGVNKLSFLPESKFYAKGLLTSKNSTLTNAPILSSSKLQADGKVDKTSVESVFYPNAGKDGGYASPNAAIHYAGAAALHDTLESTGKTIGKTDHMRASTKDLIDLMSTSSAEVQTNWFGWIHKVSQMKESDLDKVIVSNSDNAALSAMLYALRNDTGVIKRTIKVEDKSLIYKQILNHQVVTQGLAPQSYIDKVRKVINQTRLEKPDDISLLTDSTVTPNAKQLISSWKGGPGTWDMHLGATAYFARGYGAIGRDLARQLGKDELALTEIEQTFKELYESSSSIKLRAEFERLADTDGFVYLYRGLKAKHVRGSSPVESMTTNYDKAVEFAKGALGRVDLYKIHASDIIGAIKDIKGRSGDSTEILVRASARQSEATLDAAGKTIYRAQMAQNSIINPASNTHSAGQSALEEMILQNKAMEMDAMLANGLPVDAIAIKTNSPRELVEAYIHSSEAGTEALRDVISGLKSTVKMDSTTGNLITTPAEARSMLIAANKPIRLQGNLLKNPYIEGHAALTNKQMASINDLYVSNLMLASKSQAVRELGNYMSENSTMMQMLNQMLVHATKQGAGVRFFNSFDFYSRNMKDLGPAVSAIAKRREKISNDMIERVAKPIQGMMLSIKDDPLAVVEFNTFKVINDGLRDWRGINKDGFLVQKVIETDFDGKVVEIIKPVEYQGKPYQLKSAGVLELLREVQKQSVELRAMGNTTRQIKGVGPISDIGLWLPSFNPMNKYIAYVHDTATDNTKLLFAKTSEGLAELVDDYKIHLNKSGITGTNILTDPNEGTKVISKGVDQEMWSIMNGRMDPITMEIADVTKIKSGSASSAVVPNSLEVFGEIIGGYEHYITANMRNITDTAMSDTMYMLDRLSAVNKFEERGQPLDAIKKFVSSSKDPAAVIKNTLLGDSLLGEYGGWKAANSSFETGLMYGQRIFNGIWEGAIAPLTRGLFTKSPLDMNKMRKMDYEKLSNDLEDAGIPNPWSVFDKEMAVKYSVPRLEESADTSKRIVYAGNALAATIALRFGELAQPLVNIMSLPILTYLAKAQEHPDVFLGIQKVGGKIPNAAQVMFEGARASNSPMWKRLNDKWEKLGYFTPMISEANDVMQMSRSMDKGAINTIERALDSKIVEFMSKPADVSEGFVRRQTMFTGAVLARHLYPSLDDAGITIFARDFMDKAVGNFHASQRPVFFQGTLGVALGLFQTYSLTFAQNVYRQLELKNYKVLGKAALTQSGIFGTGSLPGFEAVSNQIGEHYSDDNVDLVTGSYRALADPLAETVLYGLPSQLGIGTHTRGDTTPRFPGLSGESIVAWNFGKQAIEAVSNVARALGEGDASIPRAVGEALSLQSISRPIARGAELLTGFSKTGPGNTVQTPDEVWTFVGVGARILGTRPLEEVKLRDAMHMNSFYNSIDSKNRNSVIDKIQTKIRAGTLSDDDISAAGEKYFDNGGTPMGWRAAINKAIATTETSGKESLLDKLKPNSALNLMIDMND